MQGSGCAPTAVELEVALSRESMQPSWKSDQLMIEGWLPRCPHTPYTLKCQHSFENQPTGRFPTWSSIQISSSVTSGLYLLSPSALSIIPGQTVHCRCTLETPSEGKFLSPKRRCDASRASEGCTKPHQGCRGESAGGEGG